MNSMTGATQKDIEHHYDVSNNFLMYAEKNGQKYLVN